MRYPASEKAEIIGLIEQSHLPAGVHWTNSASREPHSIAGTTAIVRVGLKRWLFCRPPSRSTPSSPRRAISPRFI